MKVINALIAMAVLVATLLVTGEAFAGKHDRTTGRGTGPVVYVTSQGLYYDSIVVVGELPQRGRFQQLIPGPNGLETEWGPGDYGHVGGRWWIDVNENEEMDGEDMFFLCPLLGPGRETL